jgi:hypothetical protein
VSISSQLGMKLISKFQFEQDTVLLFEFASSVLGLEVKRAAAQMSVTFVLTLVWQWGWCFEPWMRYARSLS